MDRRRFTLLLGSSPLLAQAPASAPELEWHDAKKLRVEGLGFKDQKAPYDRLPLRAEGVVRPVVWDLSRDSAGVLVRFITNATHPLSSSTWNPFGRPAPGTWVWQISSVSPSTKR